MAFHNNHVEANIILADSNDACSSVLHLSFLHSLFLIMCRPLYECRTRPLYVCRRRPLYECDTSTPSHFELLQEYNLLVSRFTEFVEMHCDYQVGLCGGRLIGAVMTKY
jgi:hypothetical protein